MHSQLLAISAAVLLMTSTVNALGNSEDFLGGLTSTVTDNSLLYPELALAQGQVGGLRRRKVHDLANGPRYGFPATEKKAAFDQGNMAKRSIVGLLTQPQAKTATKATTSDGEEDEENEGDNSPEAKRSLKALRRRKVKRDLKGALFKAQMGSGGVLDESQKMVTEAQKSVNKVVGQVGRTADGMAISLTENNGSKAASSKSSSDAAEADADKKSSTQKAETPDSTAAPKEDQAAQPQVPDVQPAGVNTSPSGNMKVNPDYMKSGSGDQEPGSNYNAKYFG